jgi:predicted nucleic acid-binding Zn ribbon protein
MGSDPVHIGSVIAESLRRRGWQHRLEIAQVHARWEAVVGAAVASHCRPTRLHPDGTLEVAADSATWATQISFLQAQLLDRLRQECGPGLVKAVRVRTSPAGPRGL